MWAILQGWGFMSSHDLLRSRSAGLLETPSYPPETIPAAAERLPRRNGLNVRCPILARPWSPGGRSHRHCLIKTRPFFWFIQPRNWLADWQCAPLTDVNSSHSRIRQPSWLSVVGPSHSSSEDCIALYPSIQPGCDCRPEEALMPL
jgi:hypothetical protein